MLNGDMSSNRFREGSKARCFCDNANIDWLTGFSEVVNANKLEGLGLKTTNGGDWCRSDGTLGRVFNIDRKRSGVRITSVQLVGYKKNNFDITISKVIRDHYKNKPCTLLCITGNGQSIELDHKDGRKDKYSNEETVSDYQMLHKCANDAKRSHCSKCKSNGIRFDARLMGYVVPQWIGGETYNGSCIGCFWYDPPEFNHQVSESFKKVR